MAKLFSACGITPECSRRAISLRRTLEDDGTADVAKAGCWEVVTECGRTQKFDAVVLTQPVPEMLQLLDGGEGEAGRWLEASGAELTRDDLSALQYSSRYALSLFFEPSSAGSFASNIDWVARYINREEDDALVYLAHDSAKRQAETQAADPVSLIAHTSVPYGLKHLKAATDDEVVKDDLTQRVRKLLRWLPEAQHSVLRTWTVSQVRTPLSLPAGASCWRLAPPGSAGGDGTVVAPPLILAGDAFSPLGSRFDGCVQSGEAAARELLAAFGK